eukprot:TRINITY_DN2752_c0_g1_i2.p1 TRINITY_DN2752_c0_g1~~TRINITY_DN2752_c0_g1_i2.p1  ORF type:complete len:144 (+),score=28.69 TRINITY_DN2752_c0_g1_i2:344-775(+)
MSMGVPDLPGAGPEATQLVEEVRAGRIPKISVAKERRNVWLKPGIEGRMVAIEQADLTVEGDIAPGLARRWRSISIEYEPSLVRKVLLQLEEAVGFKVSQIPGAFVGGYPSLIQMLASRDTLAAAEAEAETPDNPEVCDASRE